jgi:hypothetical protein
MPDGKFKYQAQIERAIRLREARRKHFKTMKAAADSHGWSIGTFHSHEKGVRAFKYERAEVYAKAFGVDIRWLWNGRKAEKKSPEFSSRPDTDAAHSCEKIIVQVKELVEHIQLAIEAAVRLHTLSRD